MTKLSIRRLALLGGVIVFLLPAVAGAQSVAERQEAFCALVASRQTVLNKLYSTRTEAYHNAFQVQAETHAVNRTRIGEELEQARSRANHKRAASYELIKSKQDIEENRALAESYATEVEAAVATRRAAFDAARTEFHRSVDRMLSNRDQTIREAGEDLISAANRTMDSASEACRSGTPAERPSIRQDAIAVLAEARLEFGDKLYGRQDFRTEVLQAAQARNRAYREATSQFQRTMQSIRGKYSTIRN